ncbi:MAG: plasmid mobilization relaxosome protein MobC [Pseudomonadota bacterium]
MRNLKAAHARKMPAANPPDTVHDAPRGAQRRADSSGRKRRGGRPTSDPDKRKSIVVASRYTPEEYEALARKADKAGVAISTLQHDAAMKRRVHRVATPASDFELVRELKAIGINLNQLTKVANRSGRMPRGLGTCLDQLTTIMLERMKPGAKK